MKFCWSVLAAGFVGFFVSPGDVFGQGIESGIIPPGDKGYIEGKQVIDLTKIHLGNLFVLNMLVFGSEPAVYVPPSGNQFADKRERERQTAEFIQISNDLYGDIKREDVVLAVLHAPIQLGQYNFETGTYRVCLPGYWEMSHRPRQMLAFGTGYRGFDTGNTCGEQRPSLMAKTLRMSNHRAGSGRYSGWVDLKMPDDAAAEHLFNATRLYKFSADVYCGDLSGPAPGSGWGDFVVGCQINRVDFQVGGDEALTLTWQEGEWIQEIHEWPAWQ